MRKLQQRQRNDLSRFVTALDMDTTSQSLPYLRRSLSQKL